MTHSSPHSIGNGRVGIFLFAYPLFNNASLINFARVLVERGYQVDIFTDSHQPEEFVFADAVSLPIVIHELGVENTDGVTVPHWERSLRYTGAAPPAVGILHRVRRKVRSMLPARVQARIMPVWGELQWLTRLAKYVRTCGKLLQGKHYVCFVGAEVYGLTAARVLGALRKVPVVYWALELHLWRNLLSFKIFSMKVLEWACHRWVSFTVIQDDERAKLLATNNRMPLSNFVIVPATPRGKAEVLRSDYLRKKFNIPEDCRIALYAGTIVDWGLCEELAAAVANWPEKWVLVLHGWGDGRYIARVKTAAAFTRRVYVSLDFLPYDEVDKVIASADVGLALYRNLSLNHELVASASNKLGHYFRCGLPVVMSDFPGLRRLADRYRCGVCVSCPTGVGPALDEIQSNLTVFRNGAVRCHVEKYNFDTYMEPLLERLRHLKEARECVIFSAF